MVDTRHPIYTAAAPVWQRCRDVCAGTDAIKQGAYLPRPSGMSAADFVSYRERAQFYNAFARTVGALTGVVCGRAAQVDVPETLRPHLLDVTLQSESLDTVVYDLVRELLTVGRGALLVDLGERPAVRPYWVRLGAEQVINWRTASLCGDPSELVQVVYRDDTLIATPEQPFAHVAQERYRELALNEGVYQVRLWTRAALRSQSVSPRDWTATAWITPTRHGQPLPFIPFTFVSVDGITPQVARPPLLDLADVNIGHYRNSADHEHGLYLTALPTAWVAGAGENDLLTIGPSYAWKLEKDGKAGMLEFTGAGLAAIREAMSAKERHMATLGASLLDEPAIRSAETATAIRMRNAGQAAALKTLAGAVSAALTRVLRWHAWWQGGYGALPLDVQVRLSDEFFQMRITPEDVRTAMEAVQLGHLSFESFYALLEQGGWTRPGVTAADEQHLIHAAEAGGLSFDGDGEGPE